MILTKSHLVKLVSLSVDGGSSGVIATTKK